MAPLQWRKVCSCAHGRPKRRGLLLAGDVDEVFMTRSLKFVNVTPKTTEQNVIVRNGKSEATVTNK